MPATTERKSSAPKTPDIGIQLATKIMAADLADRFTPEVREGKLPDIDLSREVSDTFSAMIRHDAVKLTATDDVANYRLPNHRLEFQSHGRGKKRTAVVLIEVNPGMAEGPGSGFETSYIRDAFNRFYASTASNVVAFYEEQVAKGVNLPKLS
ncbi:hypothetical protein HY405_01490 [Candidatus Microgenomates bacterium]|nr:hypothetical protein [Candidatus Microgenomates bacterium]